jgi:hypothetical protein
LIQFRAGLTTNIRGALEILSNNIIHSNVIDKISENILCFTDNLILPNFPIGEMEMDVIQGKLNKLLKTPYKDMMVREKNKIWYNFAEDAKKIWNQIKQPAEQTTKINSEIFTDYYVQN